MISHYIARETDLSTMRKALKPLRNIDLPGLRIAAYRQAGVPTEQIIELDERALWLEMKRRALLAPVKKVATDACQFVALVAFATAIQQTGDAQAASLPLPADEWAPLRWIGGILAGLVVFALALWAADTFKKRRRPAHEPYMNASEWRDQ